MSVQPCQQERPYRQYIHFTEQGKRLMGWKEEVDWAHYTIVDLMDYLERKRDEAIQFNFR